MQGIGQVILKGVKLAIGDRQLVGSDDTGPDPVRLFLEIGENLLGAVLVPAAGRNDPDVLVMVAVLREVGPRLLTDHLAAVVGDGKRARSPICPLSSSTGRRSWLLLW
jgi:hypothetical protein